MPMEFTREKLAPTDELTPAEYTLQGAEYGTTLAMQRTTMAYIRTAVSISGLGRTSSDATVQYVCDTVAIMTLFAGVAQHYNFGTLIFRARTSDREHQNAQSLFSMGYFFHLFLLVICMFLAFGGALAAHVWAEKVQPHGDGMPAAIIAGA